MKIVAIRTYTVGQERNFLFVVVETDSGLTGVGKGGVTWREASTAGFIEALAPLLIGQDPFRTEHLWQVMFRSGFFPAGRVGAAAISALDIALWDLKAQALGVPLYQLLGGLVRDKVACYPHVRGNSPQSLADAARKLTSEGWKFLRTELRAEADGQLFEPAAAVRRGVADFAALREAVGDTAEILTDVHTRLDPADAIAYCRGIEPYQPYFVEDPIRMENFESFRKLARHVQVPLAAGEQYATKWEFRQQIEEDLIDYARVDLCIVGGITEALKVAGWCETHYIKLAPHNPLGPVSTAACLHLVLATSYFGVQELPRVPGTYLQDVFPVQVPYADGYLLPPTKPGLGIVFDEEAAKKHPVIVGGGCPQLRRADGTFTNW
ncbi:MAG: mandelate racemase/muconate lactonizing enzyme family protein [Planctomycetaceae bacterium]|nr:mandelate racemase/muconate lactonizing enzyme family protein [Planctomycetaceae bacterium]